MPECLLGNIKIHIEIPVFLMFFALLFEGSVTTNLIIYRTCYVTLGFNESECALLGINTDNTTAELESKVQPHANILLMSRSLTQAIIPPILCFFLGPWSDKYGRKPIMLTTLGGGILSSLIMITVTVFSFASPWFFLLSVIPNCLFGGFPSYFTVVMGYINDVTIEENRGLRMGAFEAAMTMGIIAGTLSSSYVLNASGYVVIYIISTLCVVLAWLFTFFLISESVLNFESTVDKLRNLFSFTLLKDTVHTTFKKRENYDRALILSIISLLVIFIFGSLSDSSVMFLFLRHKFHWSLKTFTYYVTINNVVWIVGGITGAYIMNKLLYIKETIVILLGLLSSLFASVFLAVASRSWHVYVAGATKCLGGAVGPMARFFLSKLIPAEETGKVFSVVTGLEALGALLGAPFYAYLYNSTYLTFPGAFNVLTAGIFLCDVLLMGVIFILTRHRDQGGYNNLINEASFEEKDSEVPSECFM